MHQVGDKKSSIIGVCGCGRLRTCVTFCDQNYLHILSASSVMLHGIIGCLVTDISSNPRCPIFGSEAAFGRLGPCIFKTTHKRENNRS